MNEEEFLSGGGTGIGCDLRVLFRPTDRSPLQTYCATKTYLILTVMEDVKTRLVFYRLQEDGDGNDGGFVRAGGDSVAKIRSCHAAGTPGPAPSRADASRAGGEVSFEGKGLVVTQGNAVSKDGTEVPYFLVKREGSVVA